MKEESMSFDELQLFSRREMIIRSVIAVPIAGIIWRLWNLQIKKGDNYKDLSKGNRIRPKTIAAPRGIIYDRNGVILAKNIPSYILTLVQEDVKEVMKIELVLQKISQTLKIPMTQLQSSLNSALLDRKKKSFEPIQIYEDLTMRQIALIESYQEEFPGISIDVVPRRYYPLINTGAHVFGYMSKITKAQLKKLPYNKYKSARIIGREGIESVYNEQLIGSDGGKQVEVNSIGREIRTFPNTIEQKPGNDLILNIDSVLQKKVEEIMGDRKGAAIVMNPHNGEVLSMVSLPAFDPNEFSQGLSVERWEELSKHPDHILNNKCIQGGYSPGSTFKMLVAAAALEMGIIDHETEILCEGYFKLKRKRKYCNKRSGHGYLNVVQALEQSCNVFFFELSMEIGIEKIKEYASKFGLGLPTNIDLLHESRGLVPDKTWKLKRFKKEWLKGETPNVAIGQGFISVTPMQLLSYVNVIANGGYFVTPRIAGKIIENNPKKGKLDDKSYRNIIETKIKTRDVDILPETLEILRQGMEQNVNTKKGTGRRSRSDIVRIAGKTGTTQVISFQTRDKIKREKGEVEEKFKNHAWFVSFAPAENPIISSVVLIENGETGGNAAGLTKQIIEYYFTEITSLPKPVFDSTPNTESSTDTPHLNLEFY